MRIGVVVPIADGDLGSPGAPTWPQIRDFGQRAESFGFDSLWAPDHLLPHLDYLGYAGAIHEGWTIVTALAASTARIKVGTLVMAVPWRNPALLAKMAVSADQVSGGRLILGLGTGYHEPEFSAFGYPPAEDHPVARLEEALRIIVPLLRGESVTVAGRYVSADHVVLLPAPDRPIPVLIAAKGPRMLRLTARWADAWNTAWYARPDERLDARMAAFDEALAAEGRSAASVVRTVGMRVADEPADELAEAIAEFASRGADHLIIRSEPPRDERSLERVADAVERYRATAPALAGGVPAGRA